MVAPVSALVSRSRRTRAARPSSLRSPRALAIAIAIAPPLLAALAGCSAADADRSSARADEIVGGVVASDHPEVALFDYDRDGERWACSGSVIAPRVILTAGHCVDRASHFAVTAPYAGAQTSTASRGVAFDYVNDGETVNTKLHDVGLVILDAPIRLDRYPTIASAAVPEGTRVITLGRKVNGALTNTDVYASPETRLLDGAAGGFPNAYVLDSNAVEAGDSGGPVEEVGAATTTIVAVNSTGDGHLRSTVARVDLVYDWIQQQIAAAGGDGKSPPVTPAPPPPDAPWAAFACPFGDGVFCGGHSTFGDFGTLYRCAGGAQSVAQVCANGCAIDLLGQDHCR